MVGQSFLIGNLGAKWERPGIEETSSGVGISLMRLGNWLVRALLSEIGVSPTNGIICRPPVLRHCFDEMPSMVMVFSVVGSRSDSSMPNSPTTSG